VKYSESKTLDVAEGLLGRNKRLKIQAGTVGFPLKNAKQKNEVKGPQDGVRAN